MVSAGKNMVSPPLFSMFSDLLSTKPRSVQAFKRPSIPFQLASSVRKGRKEEKHEDLHLQEETNFDRTRSRE
jgi:hypothetical protein